LITEVGCLRCDLSHPYRAFPPHSGALLQQQLQQQQMQAPILFLRLTGRLL
jgi:FixJ family two-component response regulator